MTTAVLRGEVDMVLDSMTGPLPNIRAGKLRAIAITGAKRSSVVPDVPTIAEAGLPGYEYKGWTGVLAPVGTPKEVVNRLSAEIAKAIRAPDARQRLESLGYEPVSNAPEEFAALIENDLRRFGKVIRDANIRVD